MPNPLINIGAAINDGTGELGPRGWLQKINRLPVSDGTINAGSGDYTGTKEQKLTAAIAAAVAAGSKYVWVPQSMLPYTASLVTFNPAVTMMREGGFTSLNFVDVAAYGAALDNTTDDTASWVAAFAAVALEAGPVFHPGGASIISATLTLPVGGSLLGIGGGTAPGTLPGSIIRCKTGTPLNPMLTVSAQGTFGDRYGMVRDIQLDGNSAAVSGLLTGIYTVERTFTNLVIRNCTSVGLNVVAAQNNLFDSCNFEENGTTGANDAQVVLDQGAGNNVFLRCEMACTQGGSTGGKYHILIRESAVSGVGGFNQPASNSFIGCVIERSNANSVAAIYQKAGRHNVFLSCDISETVGAIPTVLADATEAGVGGSVSSHLRFSHCRFNGSGANDTFQLTGVSPVYMDNCFVENFLRCFRLDDNSSVEITPPFYGGATTIISPSGAKTGPNLVTGLRLLGTAGVPSGGGPPGIQGTGIAVTYDSTGNAPWMFNGAWRMLQHRQKTIATYSTSITLNAANGDYYLVVVTDGVAFTMNAPTNAVDAQELTVDIFNNSGGAMGVITWNATFRLAGAFANPATGQHRLITYRRESTASAWREVSRSAADQPN